MGIIGIIIIKIKFKITKIKIKCKKYNILFCKEREITCRLIFLT